MSRRRIDLDPVQILADLGAAVWSPDFDAYASGTLPAWMIRCVLCGKAPCKCRYCEAPYRSYLAPEDAPAAPCGMRIDPDGQCPRGHWSDDNPGADPDATDPNPS